MGHRRAKASSPAVVKVSVASTPWGLASSSARPDILAPKGNGKSLPSRLPTWHLEVPPCRLANNSIVQDTAMVGIEPEAPADLGRDTGSQMIGGTVGNFGLQFTLFKAEVFGWEESEILHQVCDTELYVL